MDIIHFPSAKVNSHLENKAQNEDNFADFCWKILKTTERKLTNPYGQIFLCSQVAISHDVCYNKLLVIIICVIHGRDRVDL